MKDEKETINIYRYIRMQLRIEEMLRDYVPDNKIYCPMCKEHKIVVKPEKQIFYCFSCRKGGDIISLVAQAEDLTQAEAALLLCKRFDLKIPKELKHSFKILSETAIEDCKKSGR